MARFKLISEVHLVLRRKGRLLMLKRANTGYMDGFYSLVAGHVDGGETFRSAMVRETKEEAGLTLRPEDIRLVHTMHRLSDSERLSLFFEVPHWEGEPVNAEPDKCEELIWADPKKLPQNTVPYVASALAMIARGKSYSEFGWPT